MLWSRKGLFVSGDRSSEGREVLESWKEIATYLGRDVRTCRRWEENLGLPIHRLDGSPKARVLAYKDEIDWWLDAKLHEHDSGAAPASPAGSPGRDAARMFGPRLPFAVSALRRWYALVGFTAVMAVGVLGLRMASNSRPFAVPDGENPAIAVLPFVNATGDDGLNYLRESVPDHLIRDLQRSADRLKVFTFRAVTDGLRRLNLDHGAPLTPEEMTAVMGRLGAGWIVVGSFDRSGSKIRVHYEIRAAGPRGQVRSDQVPGLEGEMAAVEGRVADGVRRAFDVPTSAAPEAFALCSIQATRLYEAARAAERKYVVDGDAESLKKTIDLFTQARDADPGCPLAYLGLGDAYQLWYAQEDARPDVLDLMEKNYRKAYDLAPDRAETNVGLAWVHFFRKDNDRVYGYLKKALAIDPSSLHVLTDVGAFFRSIGMLERAAEYFSRVIQSGGTTADMYLLRGYTYEQMGLFESALADYDQLVGLDPADGRTRCHLARVLLLMRRPDAAATELDLAATLGAGDPYFKLVGSLAAAAAGDRTAALSAVEAMRHPARPSRYSYFRSRVYAALGMNDEALATIASGIERGFDDVFDYLYTFPYLNNMRDHFYDPLRNDPRFAEILRREERRYSENLEKFGGL
jgi:tetratricopeptide (TPR) repeat protein/TolB-like protein